MRNRTLSSRLAFAGAVLSAVAPLAPAAAATQGSLGTTSTGSVTINASVPKYAQITNLSDIDLTGSNPNNTATSTQNTCVWSNTATKGYTITASGSGTSSAFTLLSGTATVPYSVAWSASSGASSGTALSPGAASGALTTTATKPGCTSSPATTSTLIVTIANTDLQSMVATNVYTGTLTLLVTPN